MTNIGFLICGFAKNVWVKSYSEKYLLRRLCGDGADRRVEMERTSR